MDVRRVAEQEGAFVAEAERDAMVDAIARKPVYSLDIEAKVLDGFALHGVETQFGGIALRQIANRSNQTYVSLSLEWEENNEVSILDIDFEVAVDGLAACHYIGDVKETGVRPARKPDTQLSAND
jgi:hypothetical protein